MQANNQQPTDVKTLATIVIVAAGAVVILAAGFFGLIALLFGTEGARIVMVVALVGLALWAYDAVSARNRRDANATTIEAFRVAVQGIIQHQSADDRGEIARDIVPLAIKTLMENQRSGQDMAKQIMQHGRFLMDNETKQAKAKPAFPFEMNVDEDAEMEELI